jgi:hypothetical protein
MAFGLTLDAIALGWIADNVKVGSYGTAAGRPRARGHRDGVIPCPGRERRHERRCTRGGRPGVRSERRDPRDRRRRPRHRRPRGRVLRARRLRAPSQFVAGFVPAPTIGAITVAIGVGAALLIPPLRPASVATLKPALEAAS